MAEIVGTPSLQKVLAIGANANSVDITGLPTPATSSSATSKDYVDTAVATKEGSITAGTTAQYFRGDKTFVTLNTTIVPEGTNLYYTDVRADARITAQKGAASGICPLDSSSKIASTYLPAIAITDTSVVASQAAMLSLTAQTGDVAVRTDVNKSFILAGTSASTLSDWQELLTPTDAVLSVNGFTGAVSLTTTNIAEGTNLYYTNARCIASTLTGYTSGAGTISSSDTILQAIQKLNANDATNANLTGPITSVGNATSIASQTGTGTTFAMSASPTFTGTLTAAAVSLTGLLSGINFAFYGTNATGNTNVLNNDNLTTGGILAVWSNSGSTATRDLVAFANTNASATGATVVNISNSSTGNALAVTGKVAINGTTTLQGTSSTTLSNITGTLRAGSVVLTAPYLSNGYTNALYWSTTDDNPTVPKAGIWAEMTGAGSFICIGTSNSYVSGITSVGLVMDQNGAVSLGTASISTLTVSTALTCVPSLTVGGQSTAVSVGIELGNLSGGTPFIDWKLGNVDYNMRTILAASDTLYFSSATATGTVGFTTRIVLDGNHSFISASSNAYLYHSTTLGLVLYGNGSADDLTIAGATGSNILSVATGTTTARFYGAVNIGGTFTRRTQSGVLSAFQIEGTDFDSSSMSLTANNNSFATTCPALFFSRSRGTAVNSNTIVQNGDRLGIMLFMGTDGTLPQAGAIIQASVDGAPGAGSMPTRLEFYTSATGSVSPTLRMTISSTGLVTFATALTVANGGTGLTTTTAYSVLCGGTTSTGALQSVSGVGTSGQVLTSNGAGALPTWQAAAGGSFSWGATASAGTGTGLALSVGASAASATTGFSYIVNNTQTQIATGMQITLGTSNLSHLGIGISLKSANTSGQGLYIDLGSTGLGKAIQIDALNGKYSSGTGQGAITFGTSINNSTGSAVGVYFSSINSSSGTGYGIYYNLLHGGGSGTAYGIYMGNIGNGTGTTGYGIYMNSLNHTGTGNERYFSLNNNQSASLAAQTSDCADILYSRTNTATTGTIADNYNVLYIKRTNVQNGAGGTFTNAGSCLKLENVATQTAGTLTDTTFVLSLAQGALTTTNFKRVIDCAGVTIWKSDGTSPNGTLTGTAGDICLNGTSGKIYYCTGTTVWL